jgi:Xaa-Pro aminopeptidase
MLQLDIPKSEHRQRLGRIRQYLREQSLDALCLFSSIRIFYLTGFAHIQTERPIALVVPKQHQIFVLVPELEQEHAACYADLIPRVYAYPEYPGRHHPMLQLQAAMEAVNLASGRIGVDADGYGAIWGYEGPRLSELLPSAKIVNVRKSVDEMRMIKSPVEIALLKESAKLGKVAHSLLEAAAVPGTPEIQVSQHAAVETTKIMLSTYGPGYTSKRWNASPAFAFLISGPRTSLPHGLPSGRKLQKGDVVITSCSAEVGGYMAELERTLFVGEPTKEKAKYFDLMLGAREQAFQAIAPGKTCASVDRAVSQFLESNGCKKYSRHHVGHALGLEPHEAPFLDEGDETVLQPGMVFSVEPGIYVEGVGGFRHSDTVVVTDNGAERITNYPTDLNSLTLLN